MFSVFLFIETRYIHLYCGIC